MNIMNIKILLTFSFVIIASHVTTISPVHASYTSYDKLTQKTVSIISHAAPADSNRCHEDGTGGFHCH